MTRSSLVATAAHLEVGRGRFAVVAHATVTLGPVDRLLGLLALTQGDVDTAVADLRAAVALAAQSPLWLARCQLALATALRTRDAAGRRRPKRRVRSTSARLAATSARTRRIGVVPGAVPARRGLALDLNLRVDGTVM